MEFCPKCGSLMVMKKSRLSCPRCGYTSKAKGDMTITETIKNEKGKGVVDEKKSQLHPITEHTCEKCGHTKAYFWIRQMRAGDEAESKFYKCVKCGHVERIDD